MLFEKARAAAERTQTGGGMGNDGAASSLHAPVPGPYGRSNSAFSGVGQYGAGSYVASPTSSDPPAFTPPLVHTPAAGKSGEELFAAGLAAMGRQSMYSVAPSQASQSPPPVPPQQSYAPIPLQQPYAPTPLQQQYVPTSPPQQPQRVTTPPYSGGGSSLGHSPSQRRFPSAAEEKAALAYMAAKQRVEQAWANEGAGAGGSANGNAHPHSPGGVPSYDALYGSTPPPATTPPLTRPLSVQRRTPVAADSPLPTHSSPPPMPPSDLPPSFTPNLGPAASALSALEEKARLRRQYEEQDTASGSASNLSPPGPPSVTPPPPIPTNPPSGHGYSAQDEKERMRLMYAEQDAAVRTNERRATVDSGRRAALPAPPMASHLPPVPGYDTNANGNGLDPPPFTGGFINPATFKPLSAVEEKAKLRAQYEAEANGHAINGGGGSSDEPPPPSFESHYQSHSPPQHSIAPPSRSVGPTPEPGAKAGGLQRDPTISMGKRRATQTPAPPEEAVPRSGFVAPPPPPPLMPVSVTSLIKVKLAR